MSNCLMFIRTSNVKLFDVQHSNVECQMAKIKPASVPFNLQGEFLHTLSTYEMTLIEIY